jgi:dynein heavy chain, axonemal
MATDILSQVRDPFLLKEVEKKYPFNYEESMNSVLLQEMARFNTLIEIIRNSIQTLIKTLEGKLVMNADIERMLISFNNN